MEPADALKALGFSSREAAVYLACLRLGPAAVDAIAKEAGTFRTYTYDILRELTRQGLVHKVTRERKQLLEATDPERLVEIARERMDTVSIALPSLRSLQSQSVPKPSVAFYEGLAGVNVVHDTVLREVPAEVLVLGNPEKHFEVMKFYLRRFVEKRVTEGIRARVIIKDSKIGREWMKGREREELRETRFFPLQPASFPAVTYVWGDKVAHFTVERALVAVVIESPEIAHAQKMVFENLWSCAKRR